MFCDSIVIKKIAKFWLLDSKELYLFGDHAYNTIKKMMSFFYRGNIIEWKKRLFNNQMFFICISVK